MKIFTLGTGAMGSLVAHELSKRAQLLLLMRTQAQVDKFMRMGSEIEVKRPLGDQFTVEKSKHLARSRMLVDPEEDKWIENMIVATKTYQTEAAIEKYVPFLNASSNVILVQNGMGVYHTLKKRFWPGGKVPNFFQAISTHGAFKTDLGSLSHVGAGSLVISGLKSETQPEVIQMMLESKALNASYVHKEEFQVKQVEKLAINACINPLTAIYDCRNGDLLLGSQIIPMFRRIIIECIAVAREEFNLDSDIVSSGMLSVDNLVQSVMEICQLTLANSSSMRQDIRHLNTTEIDSINGYIVLLGKKHGVTTSTNEVLYLMIKDKLSIEKAHELKL